MDSHHIALSLLPKNFMSYVLGMLVRLRWPTLMARWLNAGFARLFKLDLSEAEFPLAHYATIEEVFTRRLKPGVRQWHTGLSSPADGYVVRSDAVEDGETAIQIKGFSYSLRTLVHGPTAQGSRAGFVPAWYTTVYLAPHNYHRVHTPVAATLTAIRYIPGRLWPVNARFTRLVPQLLCQNERMVFDLQTASGGKLSVVMVGAFNVGRMETPFAPELTTNTFRRQLPGAGGSPREKICSMPLALAAELGTFMLGSTVVVICDAQSAREFQPRRVLTTQPIKVGEPL